MKYPRKAAERRWTSVAMTRGAARFLGFFAWSECRSPLPHDGAPRRPSLDVRPGARPFTAESRGRPVSWTMSPLLPPVDGDLRPRTVPSGCGGSSLTSAGAAGMTVALFVLRYTARYSYSGSSVSGPSCVGRSSSVSPGFGCRTPKRAAMYRNNAVRGRKPFTPPPRSRAPSPWPTSRLSLDPTLPQVRTSLL
jgi:hypothetical protein